MLVVLQPGLDGSVDPATTVHLASQLLVSHRVGRINGLTIGLDHLGLRVPASSDKHVASVPIVGLESLLVDLLLAATVATGLAVTLDHLHDGVGVLLPLLQRHRTVLGHELPKPGVVLRHDELAVVRDPLLAGQLVDLALRLGQVGERQAHTRKKNNIRHLITPV